MILVDTSILIDHLRGDERARRAVERAWRDGVRIAGSVLTKVEVLAGVRSGEEPATRELLAELQWVAVDDVIADRAGDLAARYLQSHPGVEVVDYVIAASAQALDAELWTTNLRHFPMFPGLASPYDA